MLTSMPPVGGKPGPKREKPERLQGDTGYDSRAGAAVVAVVGDHPDPGQQGACTRQRFGGVPLVRGTHHRLAA